MHLVTMTRQRWNYLPSLLIFCLALGLRLTLFSAFFQSNPHQCAFDSKHYHELATNLVTKGSLVHNDGRPQFYRMPGYSIFLATCYKIFGSNPNYAILVQIVLASLLPLLLMAVAASLFGTTVSTNWLIGILAAIHPGLLIFANLLMTETIFCLLVLLFTFLVMRPHRPSPGMLALGGALLGLATITRPLGIEYFCISLLVLVAHFGIHKHHWHYAALIGGWLSTMAWWPLRNWLLTGTLFMHTLPGPHLLNHGAVPILMQAQNISHQEAQRLVYAQVNRQCSPDLAEPQKAACIQHISTTIILAHPLYTALHMAKHMLKTTLGLFSAELLWMDADGTLPPYDTNRSWRDALSRFLIPTVQHGWIRWFIYAELLYNLLLLICGLGGLFVCWRQGMRWQLVWLVLLAGCTIFLSGFCGYARLRLPTEPFFIMLAGMFLSCILQEKGVDAWRVETNKKRSL